MVQYATPFTEEKRHTSNSAIKVFFHTSIIWPNVTYGAAQMTTSDQIKTFLMIWERKILRKICKHIKMFNGE
jgi:hypothetical protein